MFNMYPYTDFHNLNLDWVLAKMKELYIRFDEFTARNTLNYAGIWQPSKMYKKFSIVTYENASYLSIADVMPGVDINNSTYWVKLIDYDYKLNNLNIINVVDFGAVPDGVTDCSDAFIECIQKCNENAAEYMPINNAFVIPSGEYYIKRTIRVPSSVHIILLGTVKLITDFTDSVSAAISYYPNTDAYTGSPNNDQMNMPLIGGPGTLNIVNKSDSPHYAIGLQFESPASSAIQRPAFARTKVENITFTNFEKCLSLSPMNMYMITFNNLNMGDSNDVGVVQRSDGLAGTSNEQERITFTNCQFTNLKIAFNMESNNNVYQFENCSFDNCDDGFLMNGCSGFVFNFHFCHIENMALFSDNQVNNLININQCKLVVKAEVGYQYLIKGSLSNTPVKIIQTKTSYSFLDKFYQDIIFYSDDANPYVFGSYSNVHECIPSYKSFVNGDAMFESLTPGDQGITISDIGSPLGAYTIAGVTNIDIVDCLNTSYLSTAYPAIVGAQTLKMTPQNTSAVYGLTLLTSKIPCHFGEQLQAGFGGKNCWTANQIRYMFYDMDDTLIDTVIINYNKYRVDMGDVYCFTNTTPVPVPNNAVYAQIQFAPTGAAGTAESYCNLGYVIKL